jgi:hypothetical protein
MVEICCSFDEDVKSDCTRRYLEEKNQDPDNRLTENEDPNFSVQKPSQLLGKKHKANSNTYYYPVFTKSTFLKKLYLTKRSLENDVMQL